MKFYHRLLIRMTGWFVLGFIVNLGISANLWYSLQNGIGFAGGCILIEFFMSLIGELK